jgi:hypothetical protein
MKMISRLMPVVALLATSLDPAAVQAHHSFAAMYDANKPIRITGKLTEVNWVNPHSNFTLEVKGKDGQIAVWYFEGAGPGTLSRRGFNKGDIKVGDILTVDGYLARSGKRVVDVQRVTLPDGRVFNAGTPGAGGPGTGAAQPGSAPAGKPQN